MTTHQPTPQPETDRPIAPPTPAPAAWITPAVHTIHAGQAEVGTRTRADGAFTSS